MTDLLKQCIKSLKRKKVRTWLTITSIAIGVASVVLTTTIGSYGRDAVNDEMSRLGVDGVLISRSSAHKTAPFAQEELSLLRADKSVSEAIPVSTLFTQVQMRNFVAKTVVWGIDQGATQVISLEEVYGRMLNSGDISGGRQVCVVDMNTARAFYSRDNVVGKNLKLLVNGSYSDFTVIGVVQSGGSLFQSISSAYTTGFVYIPYTTMQTISNKKDFDQIAVKFAEDSEAISQNGANLLQSLTQSAKQVAGTYSLENMAQHKEQLDTILQVISVVVSMIAGISLLVSGLGVMTVMLVSVKERTREIGIKKSVGASTSIIMREFMLEALMLSLIGSLIGAGFGVAVTYLGGLVLGLPISLPYLSIGGCIGITVLLGLLFGVYPSYKASRLLPIDALRME